MEGEILLTGQLQFDRQVVIGADVREVLVPGQLADIDIGVQLAGLDQRGQHALASLHGVATRDARIGQATIDRGADGGVVQIQTGTLELGDGALELCIQAGGGSAARIGFLARDQVALDQTGGATGLAAGIGQFGLDACDFRFQTLYLGLEGALIKAHQRRAGAYLTAFGEQHFFDFAAHAWAQLHALGRFQTCGVGVPGRDRLRLGGDDFHRRGSLLRVAVFFTVALAAGTERQKAAKGQ